MDTYTIHNKVKKKYIFLRTVVMVYPILECLEIAQYYDEHVITIENLLETT